IVLSAAIALSSTTVLGNAMAGLMLRSINAFKPGDYMRVGDHAGRVTEMDLLHVEIQTEQADLTTLSNIYLVTHPFRVVRSQEGTILSVPVSLGYDVPRERVEQLLLKAIEEAGLQKPFVHITDLGDYSVTYRAAGLLKPAKKLIAKRARLRATTLDALHRGGIEIVSPTFMNQRTISPDTPIIPKQQRQQKTEPKGADADDVVFEKAEEAESLESMRERHKAMLERVDESQERLKSTETDREKEALTTQIERTTRTAEQLADLIAKNEEKLSSEG
ncbi:MAG: mechanosensitive ion channel family protein, partial [Gammaproteobacteria bacterium]|nr:mechanosensitive ion channel family protein [Gammaproteobacteria bacterium]